jgi:AcrR family transcriptional regulator
MAIKGMDPRVASSRQRIAAAAHRLFIERGYVATTIEDIAAGAEIAIQTIYNTVGNKAAVLNHVLDTVVAGDRPPGTVVQFLKDRAATATTAGQVVEMLADWFVEVHPRSASVFAAIRDAAAVDPQVAKLWRRRERTRFDNYHLAAQAIADVGGLPADRTVEDLAAAIWSLGHPDTFAFLTQTAGWDLPRYRRWIGDQLTVALVGLSTQGDG